MDCRIGMGKRPVSKLKGKRKPSHLGLDSLILDNYLGRMPKTSMDIYKSAIDDYGSVSRRTIMRCLAKLRKNPNIKYWLVYKQYYYLKTRKSNVH